MAKLIFWKTALFYHKTFNIGILSTLFFSVLSLFFKALQPYAIIWASLFVLFGLVILVALSKKD